ncbi:MAG TPA: hypothetical protein VMF08_03040 [Candidatus Sulfotelmatobacter sp.]|nr:hypothetical protein [Candidatus Sulfotelmatobacter sp.]
MSNPIVLVLVLVLVLETGGETRPISETGAETAPEPKAPKISGLRYHPSFEDEDEDEDDCG